VRDSIIVVSHNAASGFFAPAVAQNVAQFFAGTRYLYPFNCKHFRTYSLHYHTADTVGNRCSKAAPGSCNKDVTLQADNGLILKEQASLLFFQRCPSLCAHVD
jgi:hypothetical protein